MSVQNIFPYRGSIAICIALFLFFGAYPVSLFADVLPQQKIVSADFLPTWRDGSVEASLRVRNISDIPLELVPRIIVQAPGKEIMEDDTLLIGAPVHIWTEEHASLKISPQQEKQIDFSFYLSSHLDSGTYAVLFQAVAPDGTVLGGAMNELKIVGDGRFLDFSQKKCKMVHTIGSRTTFFDPQEAPPYPAGISPTVLCTIKNTAPTRVAGQVRFRINEFAAFGYYLHDPETVQGEVYNFAPGEEREISLTLPAKIKPQVYEAAVQMVSVEHADDRLSPLVPLRWTVQGEAARISSWSVDKETYLDGSKSQIDLTVSYYASPDLFWQELPTSEESRIEGSPLSGADLVVEARSSQGKICGQKKLALGETHILDMQVKKISLITDGCTSPELIVQIVSDGKVLSSAIISGTPLVVAETTNGPRQSSLRLVLLGIGIFMVVLLYTVRRIQRKHENAS